MAAIQGDPDDISAVALAIALGANPHKSQQELAVQAVPSSTVITILLAFGRKPKKYISLIWLP